jgi:hypothetical protein
MYRQGIIKHWTQSAKSADGAEQTWQLSSGGTTPRTPRGLPDGVEGIGQAVPPVVGGT